MEALDRNGDPLRPGDRVRGRMLWRGDGVHDPRDVEGEVAEVRSGPPMVVIETDNGGREFFGLSMRAGRKVAESHGKYGTEWLERRGA